MNNFSKDDLISLYPHIPDELLDWYIDIMGKFERLNERKKQAIILGDMPYYDTDREREISILLNDIRKEIDMLETELLGKNTTRRSNNVN